MHMKSILANYGLVLLAAFVPQSGVGRAEAASARCEAAWAAYQDLKARSVMEEAQYPLTAEGAEVRAACGRNALPAPANADINPVRPRVRRGRTPESIQTPPIQTPPMQGGAARP